MWRWSAAVRASAGGGGLLAANGVSVVVSDHQAAERVVAASPHPAAGRSAHGRRGEAGNRTGSRGLRGENFGALHLAFNNAGVGGPPARGRNGPQEWQRIIDINLGGVMHAMRAQIPRCWPAGGSAIVNMSRSRAWWATRRAGLRHGQARRHRADPLGGAGLRQPRRAHQLDPSGYIDAPLLSGWPRADEGAGRPPRHRPPRAGG